MYEHSARTHTPLCDIIQSPARPQLGRLPPQNIRRRHFASGVKILQTAHGSVTYTRSCRQQHHCAAPCSAPCGFLGLCVCALARPRRLRIAQAACVRRHLNRRRRLSSVCQTHAFRVPIFNLIKRFEIDTHTHTHSQAAAARRTPA